MSETLETLIAKHQIETLRVRFAHGLDAKDFEPIHALFTDSVETDYSAYGLPPETMSRDKLLGIFRHSFGRPQLKTEHIYSNFLVELDAGGTTARSQCNFVGHHFIPEYAGGDELTLHAQYRDRLTKTADGWRISGTTLVVFYMKGNPALLQ